MRNFLFLMEEELAEQERKLREAERVLARPAEGFLKCKPRKQGNAFYQVKASKEECNITRRPMVLRRLVRKRIQEEIRDRAEVNVKFLRKLLDKYRDNDLETVLHDLPESYRKALMVLPEEMYGGKPVIGGKRYVQEWMDPEKHIHDTVAGMKVRSKSEVIIVNALVQHDIPFHYEKKFPYPDEEGIFYRPDFTFHLPDDQTKIWEHLGLLSDVGYCEHNAHKLHLYQQHGFVVGKNLILTMDDHKGNCRSEYIDEVIRTQFLPFFH